MSEGTREVMKRADGEGVGIVSHAGRMLLVEAVRVAGLDATMS